MTDTNWPAIAAIAAVGTIFVTFVGPIAGAQVAEFLARRREQRQRKLSIFTTIMQHRHNIPAAESVAALNLIDVVYVDSSQVRDAWSELYKAFNDQRLNTREGNSIREGILIKLLKAMAEDLGMSSKFRPEDFSRIYFPEALAEEHDIKAGLRRRQLDELKRVQQEQAQANLPLPGQ